MDVALALVRLHDEQVRNVSADMVLVRRGVAAEDLLQSAKYSVSCIASNIKG